MKSVVDCKYVCKIVWSMLDSGINLRPSSSICTCSDVSVLLDMLMTSLLVLSVLCALYVFLCVCSCVAFVVSCGLWLLLSCMFSLSIVFVEVCRCLLFLVLLFLVLLVSVLAGVLFRCPMSSMCVSVFWVVVCLYPVVLYSQ